MRQLDCPWRGTGITAGCFSQQPHQNLAVAFELSCVELLYQCWDVGQGPWDRAVTESPECAQPVEQPRVQVFCCTSAPLGFGVFLSSLQALGLRGSRILLWAGCDLGIKAALCLFLEGAGLSCRELSLLRDLRLLLHGGVRIEQLKAKLAYFCVLSYSLSTGGWKI